MNTAHKLAMIVIAAAPMTIISCGSQHDEQTDANAETNETNATTEMGTETQKVKLAEIPDIQAKPGAPVDIRYALMGTPKIGEPLEIRIDVVPHSQASQVDVSLNTVGELDIDASARGWSLQNPEPGAPERRIITTTPRAEGLFYISVEAMVETDGTRQSRVYSIPVLVGDRMIRAQTEKAEISVDEDGNPVVILHGDDGT